MRCTPKNQLPTALLVFATLTLLRGLVAQGEPSDATRTMLAAFPTADGHRTVASSMTESIRRRIVADRLPFTLQFNQGSAQRLLVPVAGGRPLGFVHTRIEGGQWGLVQIVWALDLDLSIRGFAFERCRSRARKLVDAPAFRKHVVGKAYADLRGYLSADCLSLAPAKLEVEPKAQALAVTVVRSALKAILATRYSWGSAKGLLQALAQAQRAFPEVHGVHGFESLYTRDVKNAIRKTLRAYGGSALDPDTAGLIQVEDDAGQVQGYLLRGDWQRAKKRHELWWRLSADRKVLGVAAQKWPSEALRSSFRDAVGMALADVSRAATESRFVAAEVLLVLDGWHKHRMKENPR